MPLKTLHITNAYHPTSGGISTFYRALLAGAEELGREMRLVVPGEHTHSEAFGRHGRIHYIAAPHSPWFDKRYRTIFPNRYLWGRTDLRELLRAEQADVVEICDKYTLNYLGGALRRGWIRGVKRPLVVGLSCERMDDNFRAWVSDSAFGRWFVPFYLRRIYWELFDEHIANSVYTAAELHAIADGHNIPRGLHVLPMGVDVTRFHPGNRNEEARARVERLAGTAPQTKLLLYAGRISPEKNIPLLIETMERLRTTGLDYKLLVAGAGPLEDWLKQQIAGPALFLGHLRDAQQLADLVANVDLFVHPNPREPYGIAPLEAMASGTPVLVPNAGGVLSYATADNAWLADPTGGAFAAVAQQALTDEFLRDHRRRAAISTAQSLAWPNVARRFFALYEHLYSTSAAPFTRDRTPAPPLQPSER